MSINDDFSSGEALMNMMELGVNNPPVFFMEKMYNEYISRVHRGEIFHPRYKDTVCKVIDIVNEARGAAEKKALFGSATKKGKIIIFLKIFTCLTLKFLVRSVHSRVKKKCLSPNKKKQNIFHQNL